MEDLIEIPQMEVVKLNVTDSEIAKMEEDFMGLTINSIEDRAGFKKVYESRQIVKKTRTGLVKYANELKEKALAWQRKVNGEKDRVVARLEVIETYLQEQEEKIEAEKSRIKEEADRKEAARIQGRIDALAAYGFGIDYATITAIDDATFETVLNNAKIEHQKELAAKAEEKRLAEAEQARLKSEREELEQLRAEQAKAQEIIRKENERIAKEQADKESELKRQEYIAQREKEEAAEKLRLEEKRIADERYALEQKRLHDERVAKAREEAAEEARLKAIADAKREENEKAAQILADKLEAERQASLRPDKDKLQTFSDLIGGLKTPSVTDPAAQEIANEVQILLNKCQAHIIKRIKAL